MPIQTGYPNVDPFSDAAGAPPNEHRTNVFVEEHALDPTAPTVFIEDYPTDGSWIETDHTVVPRQ